MNTLHKFVIFVVALLSGFNFLPQFLLPATDKGPAPTNSASLQLQHMREIFQEWCYLTNLQVRRGVRRYLGFDFVLKLGITEEKTLDQQIKESLGELNKRFKQLDELQEKVKAGSGKDEEITKLLEQLKLEMDSTRRSQIELKSGRIRAIGPNEQPSVSEECAKALGIIALNVAMKSPSLTLSQAQKDFCEQQIKSHREILGKSALTSSDIPLPTVWAGEVVELVYSFGQARRYGTVLPLGAGTVKLPKLATDTAFGLIASSGSVTEVSPSVGFVTFTAEKFGGLIRLPSEIDEDSIVAMGQFIARYAARQIAKCEDYQFFMSTGAGSGVNGTGEGLAKAVVTDSCYVYNGNASNSGKTKGSEAVLADFRNMRGVSTLSGAVLNNSKYYMHPTYEALLVSFNTSATVTPYIRGNGTAPATLDGFEIVWTSVLPTLSTSAAVSVVTCLFGDASFQYLGLRGGIRFDTSKEAAFATDEILVRALERMTVGLMASKAVAGLRNAAS